MCDDCPRNTRITRKDYAMKFIAGVFEVLLFIILALVVLKGLFLFVDLFVPYWSEYKTYTTELRRDALVRDWNPFYVFWAILLSVIFQVLSLGSVLCLGVVSFSPFYYWICWRDGYLPWPFNKPTKHANNAKA